MTLTTKDMSMSSHVPNFVKDSDDPVQTSIYLDNLSTDLTEGLSWISHCSYRGFIDIINEQHGTLILNYSQHLRPLQSSELKKLVENPTGTYLKGTIDPLTEKELSRPAFKRLSSQKPHLFTTEPAHHRASVYLFVHEVVDYLLASVKCEQSLTIADACSINVNDYMRQTNRRYQYKRLPTLMTRLCIDAIDSFIGSDTYNSYRVQMNQSGMTIVKGADARLVEYYRLLFNHMEEIKRKEG